MRPIVPREAHFLDVLLAFRATAFAPSLGSAMVACGEGAFGVDGISSVSSSESEMNSSERSIASERPGSFLDLIAQSSTASSVLRVTAVQNDVQHMLLPIRDGLIQLTAKVEIPPIGLN